MIHDLEELFGNDIQLTEYQFPAGIPNYIRLGYQAEKLSLNQKTGILLKPLDSNWNLASLKKTVAEYFRKAGDSLHPDVRSFNISTKEEPDQRSYSFYC